MRKVQALLSVAALLACAFSTTITTAEAKRGRHWNNNGLHRGWYKQNRGWNNGWNNRWQANNWRRHNWNNWNNNNWNYNRYNNPWYGSRWNNWR